jgi:hypothetical protein
MQVPVVLHAGYVTALCFLFSLFVSYFLDKVFPKLDTNKSRARLIAEATFEFFVIGIIIYVARMYIPALDTSKSEEVRSLPILVFIFMFFQKNLQAKINYIIF